MILCKMLVAVFLLRLRIRMLCARGFFPCWQCQKMTGRRWAREGASMSWNTIPYRDWPSASLRQPWDENLLPSRVRQVLK